MLLGFSGILSCSVDKLPPNGTKQVPKQGSMGSFPLFISATINIEGQRPGNKISFHGEPEVPVYTRNNILLKMPT